VEHRPAGSFGLDHQPLADLVPHGFERVLASAVSPRSYGLLAAPILPSLTRASWQPTASSVGIPSTPRPLALRSNGTASGALVGGPMRLRNSACRHSASCNGTSR